MDQSIVIFGISGYLSDVPKQEDDFDQTADLLPFVLAILPK